MNRLADELDPIAEKIRASFAAKDEAREKSLHTYREVIRYSSHAIRAIHRREFDQAKKLIKSARKFLDEAEQAITGCDELLYTGPARDAQKEYTEACATLAVIRNNPLPDPTKLRVDFAAYLNGLGDTVGELRRYLLDGMRQGDLSRGEQLLSAMDDIYSTLVTMDFPDAITLGLRHTTDNVRGILEKTRGDLTLAIQQKDLESRIKDFQKATGGGKGSRGARRQ
jgi:translin